MHGFLPSSRNPTASSLESMYIFLVFEQKYMYMHIEDIVVSAGEIKLNCRATLFESRFNPSGIFRLKKFFREEIS